jgi:hypothetical protein
MLKGVAGLVEAMVAAARGVLLGIVAVWVTMISSCLSSEFVTAFLVSLGEVKLEVR